MGKRILAALLFLSLTVGLGLPAYAVEAGTETPAEIETSEPATGEQKVSTGSVELQGEPETEEVPEETRIPEIPAGLEQPKGLEPIVETLSEANAETKDTLVSYPVGCENTVENSAVKHNSTDCITLADSSTSIKVGEYITLGKYYDEPILWRCVAIDENGPLMLSDKILCLKAFDAKGNSEHHYVSGAYNSIRKQYGSNCYADSNIRQWLNSKDTHITWTHDEPSNQNVSGGNPYNTESGFLSLSNFSDNERNCMKKITRKVYTNMAENTRGVTDGGSREHESVVGLMSTQNRDYTNCFYMFVTDTVFIPDLDQLVTAYYNLGNEYIKAYPTKSAVLNSDCSSNQLNLETSYKYWIAHAGTNGYSYEWVNSIAEDGICTGFRAWDGTVGVRPAFYLDESIWNGDMSETPDISDTVSVHNTDIDSIESNVEKDLNTLLSSVTLCDTTIKGPTFNVLGREMCPIKFDAKAVLNLSGLSKNITVDEDNKTVHVILGKMNKDGSASVVQTTKMCDASWSKQYNEIKDLYRAMTGLEPSGSDRHGVNNWNKFEKLKGQLNRMECDMFIKASMQCVAYLDFDYQTGRLVLSEGGLVESAELGVDLKYPIIGKFVYTTIGLKGGEEGTIKATITNNIITPQMSIKPYLTATAKITGEIPMLAKLEGGVDATLAVLLQTFDPKLQVTLNGKIFVTATVFSKELLKKSWPYANLQLYPEFKQLSLYSPEDTFEDIYTSAQSISRDYLDSTALLSLDCENSIYTLNNVYPNNNVQLLQLSGNSMMLIWTGDDGTKSDINRTSLLYCIYRNGTWGDVQKAFEDNTAVGDFIAVSDGTDVYVVFQKLNEILSDSASVEVILADSDLYTVKYTGNFFSEPVCITDDGNSIYESIDDAKLTNSGLIITWVENSKNDLFLSEGTTRLKTRTLSGAALSNIKTIVTLETSAFMYPGETCVSDDGIYYAIYNASGKETTATLYMYGSDASQKVCDADSIYNIRSLNGALYYIKNSIVYKLEAGVETEIGFGGVTSFEIVSAGGHCAMLLNISQGAGSEIYISRLDGAVWSTMEHFTNMNQHIRNYAPIMHGDGTIDLAVSVAEVNEIVREDDSPYGVTSIMVLEQCDYFDLSTTYVYYDEEEIIPGGMANFYFDVQNDSPEDLTSVTVSLTDEQGNVLDVQKIVCNIAPFSEDVLSICYCLPQLLTRTAVNLTISAGRNEINLENNTAITEYGYANLTVENLQCIVHSDNTASVKATIANSGFMDADDVIIRIHNGGTGGEVLKKEDVGRMSPGGTYNLTYLFPAELMTSLDEDVMNAVYVSVESSTPESLQSDNFQKIVFDSYSTAITATIISASDTVTTVRLRNFDGMLTNCSTVFAAFYSAEGQMLEIAPGILNDDMLTFNKELDTGWTLFFLDSHFEPVCSKVTIS